jgi:hypothetical protein
VLFGAIWAFVGTLISVVFTVAGGSVLGDVALDRRGVTTQAMPISVEPTRTRVNRRRVYRITYTFTDKAGAPRASAAGTTNGDTLARAHRREPLAIQYDPQRPSLSRLVGESASFFGWFVLLPLAFAVGGWALCLRGLRRVLRVREVYVHGVPVRAEVTEVSATSIRINRRRVMRVAYAFDRPSARPSGCSTSRRSRTATSRSSADRRDQVITVPDAATSASKRADMASSTACSASSKSMAAMFTSRMA